MLRVVGVVSYVGTDAAAACLERRPGVPPHPCRGLQVGRQAQLSEAGASPTACSDSVALARSSLHDLNRSPSALKTAAFRA